MTPPSIERAVEILTEESASIRVARDAYPVKVLQVAAAIDVVLAALDQRAAPAPHDFKSEPAYKLGPDAVSATTRRIGRPIRRREEEIAASRAIGYADCSYAVRAAMLLHDEGLVKELLDRRHGDPSSASGEPAIATACAPTALTIAMQEVDRQVERALDEHRNPPTAYRRGGGGVEVRTREHGRGPALANAPLPFVMIDGTTIAQPAPGAGRVVPFLDERGHRIGDASIDGLQVLARVTDAETAEVLQANCGQQGVSLGYQVDAVPAEPRFCPHGYMFGDGRGLGPPIDQASDGCLRRSR